MYTKTVEWKHLVKSGLFVYHVKFRSQSGSWQNSLILTTDDDDENHLKMLLDSIRLLAKADIFMNNRK